MTIAITVVVALAFLAAAALTAQRLYVTRSVQVGDEVATAAGIVGIITGEDGPKRFWLEVDDNVQVRITRRHIASIIHSREEATNDVTPTATTDATEPGT